MKVQLLRNPAKSLGCELREGESGEVDDSLGSLLVKSNIAVSLEPPPAAPVIKAVPDMPAVSESKPADISGSSGGGGLSDFDTDPPPKSAAKSSTKSAAKSDDKPSGK